MEKQISLMELMWLDWHIFQTSFRKSCIYSFSGLEQIEMTYEVPSQVIPYMVKRRSNKKKNLYQKLKQVDVNRMTPLEALQCLYDLKRIYTKKVRKS